MTRSSHKQKTFWIYALTEPGDEEVRYVGLSAIPLEGRLNEHVTKLSGKHSARADWIRGLLAEGKKPEIHLLKEFWGWRKGALALEHMFIVKHHEAGHRLLNHPLPAKKGKA